MNISNLNYLHRSLTEALSDAITYFGEGSRRKFLSSPAVIFTGNRFVFGERRDGRPVMGEEDIKDLLYAYDLLKVVANRDTWAVALRETNIAFSGCLEIALEAGLQAPEFN